VRHIVDLHGGAVRAESEGEGRGARFIIELPRTITRIDEESALESASIAGPGGLLGCRVLVVDDQEDAREVLALELTASGAEVRTVASAREALLCIGQQWPDVLLSDLGLPGADGYALMREVRRLESDQGTHLPSAAVTAYAMAVDGERARAAGFDAYIAKPIQRRRIVETVLSLWKS
jgi:CheY-like chemotaxis protein